MLITALLRSFLPRRRPRCPYCLERVVYDLPTHLRVDHAGDW